MSLKRSIALILVDGTRMGADLSHLGRFRILLNRNSVDVFLDLVDIISKYHNTIRIMSQY